MTPMPAKNNGNNHSEIGEYDNDVEYEEEPEYEDQSKMR